MAKVIKYGDTTGIESDFEQAPVGLYTLKAEEVNQRLSNNKEEMVEVIFRPTHDANGKKLKKNYSRLWYYGPLDENASWARRLKELVTAFGLKAKGGNLGSIEGKSCLGRLREGTDQDGEYRPNIGKLMPLKVEDEEEPDEDEGDEDGALDEMSRTELKAYIKENGLEISVKKSMSDEDIVEAIQESEAEAEDEEEPDDEDDEDEDDEDEEPEAEEDNYDEMSIKELRQELEDRELETKGARKVLVARLRTDDVAEPV